MSKELWVEKYRPQTLDEYVWRDPAMRTKAEEWLAAEALPHLLLSGVAGTGKTSLALLLLRLLDIPPADLLIINASRERKIEDIQDKIGNFIPSWPMGKTGIKYILLDEMDAISPAAQKMLRADMETFSSIARVIGTANYANKIIPALISRFQVVNFKTLVTDDFMVRVGEILTKENVEFDFETLDTYVKATYPDLRKCIGLVEQKTIGGKLTAPSTGDESSKDYMLDVVDLFKQGHFLQGRKLIVSQAQAEEYPEIYRFLYRNLDLFGKTQNQQDDALLIVSKAVVNNTLAFDPEILLSATLVELARIGSPA